MRKISLIVMIALGFSFLQAGDLFADDPEYCRLLSELTSTAYGGSKDIFMAAHKAMREYSPKGHAEIGSGWNYPSDFPGYNTLITDGDCHHMKYDFSYVGAWVPMSERGARLGYAFIADSKEYADLVTANYDRCLGPVGVEIMIDYQYPGTRYSPGIWRDGKMLTVVVSSGESYPDIKKRIREAIPTFRTLAELPDVHQKKK